MVVTEIQPHTQKCQNEGVLAQWKGMQRWWGKWTYCCTLPCMEKAQACFKVYTTSTYTKMVFMKKTFKDWMLTFIPGYGEKQELTNFLFHNKGWTSQLYYCHFLFCKVLFNHWFTAPIYKYIHSKSFLFKRKYCRKVIIIAFIREEIALI